MIIDFHTHIFPTEVIERRTNFLKKDKAFSMLYGNPKTRMVSAEALVHALDQERMDAAVVCGFPWKDLGLTRMMNEYLVEEARRFPDRLFALAATPIGGGTRVLPQVQWCLEQGMKGIGEIAFYAQGMGKRALGFLDALAELANGFHVPLLIHVNEPVGHFYAGKIDIKLKDIFQFVSRHSEATIVLAHWGGGLFFYELMPSVTKVVRNLYYDTAASPFLYRPQIYRIALEIMGPDRILFGSDYPLIAPSRYLKEMESVGVPARAKKRILGDNACRVLNIQYDNRRDR